ncbi:MAG: hypothetical protein II635_01975, partial [Oscillospiraceae bacterium]|nr:hypothetical protein [Oscillospiraceae bacterium]
PREKAIKTAEKVAKNARQKRRLTKEIFVKTTIYSGARKMTTIADDRVGEQLAVRPHPPHTRRLPRKGEGYFVIFSSFRR